MTAEIRHFPGGVVTREQQAELHALEASILQAIQKAKDVGVPQGLIVAIMHAHALLQTTAMIHGNSE